MAVIVTVSLGLCVEPTMAPVKLCQDTSILHGVEVNSSPLVPPVTYRWQALATTRENTWKRRATGAQVAVCRDNMTLRCAWGAYGEIKSCQCASPRVKTRHPWLHNSGRAKLVSVRFCAFNSRFCIGKPLGQPSLTRGAQINSGTSARPTLHCIHRSTCAQLFQCVCT